MLRTLPDELRKRYMSLSSRSSREAAVAKYAVLHNTLAAQLGLISFGVVASLQVTGHTRRTVQ